MLLDSLNSVEDLRKIKVEDLSSLADQVRRYMIDVVSKNGGHLAPSLGVVDLTIALHYVFNTPSDRLIWDVGHQTYAHKILTGRKNDFLSLRQFEGLSGFPKVAESDFDLYDTGHTSTSLSLALGEAVARDLSRKKHRVIAVIGDGALTGGLAFEALNNIGHLKKDMIIILNDNEHSISKNVGAMSKYLTELISGSAYNRLVRKVRRMCRKIPLIGKYFPYLYDRIRMGIKNIFVPANFFEDFGIRYFGPIDGHDIEHMIHIFKRIKSINSGPKVIHVITKKGYGYKFAEKEPVRFHGTQPFDVDTGKEYGKKKLSFSAVAGKTLCSLAEKDSRIVAVTAAMSAGTGLDEFSKKFPSKFFDVGIAEQHAVTFCAALAKNGYKPYFAVYSSFMQRAFDQLIHDVAVMNLPSVFLIDRAGIVGDDGETHHGMFDVSVFKTIPNFELLIPSDGEDLRDMIYYASKADHPVAIRYPRGYCGIESVDCTKPRKTDFSLPLKLSSSKDLIIIASADMKICAKEVSELLSNSKIKSGVVLIHSINALESAEFRTLIKNTDSFAVIESEYSRGGLSESILSILPEHKRSKMLASFGFPRKFIEHGPVDLLYDKYGLSSQKIASDIIEKLKKK